MKKSVLHLLLIASLVMLVSIANTLSAQSTYESAQSGNYSDGTTWVGGQAPPNSQHILIKSGHTVTLDRGTDWSDYIQVWNVTIEEGAVLSNNGWPLWIRTTTSSTPQYKNDGTHNGPGTMQAYENGDMRIDGNGSTNLNIEYHLQGKLEVRYTSNLTINGDIKPTQYSYSGLTSAQQRIKYEIFEGVGGTLTVNGDVYSAGNIVSNNPVSVTIPAEGTLIVNGNIYFNAAADVIFNDGTFIATGDLILGTTSSSYFWNRNSGHAEIGGDVLGGGSSWLRISQGSYTKLGGQVFPVGFGGSFLIFQATDANTIEYAGTSDQTILGSTAYRNLIISNSNATASIQSNVTVETSLTIKPGAALSHSSGTFTVNGSFTIESDAAGTGSFISNNAYNGNVERYIAGHNNSPLPNFWHLLSAPVAAQAISSFHTAGSDDFFKWSDTDGLWINRTTIANDLNPDFETNFVTGRGYLVAYETTDTKTFSGSINASDASVSGLTTINGGWHLLGNHFSSAVKWNDGNWVLNDVDAVAQVWVAADASYTPIVANEYIPAMNGFFVRANQTNASLTIPASARDHNSTNWYKVTENQDRIVLRAIDHEGQTAQTTIIRFDGNATSGYDTKYDSYFLPGFAPQLYSLDEQSNKYVLNTLPNQSEDLTIPLGFVKNQGNHFTIELAADYQGQSLYLSDQFTNQTVDLTQGSYSFGATGNDLSRFTLHFALVGIDEMEAFVPSLHAWHANGVLHLNDSEPGLLSAFDLLGRPVFKQQLTGNGHLTIELELRPGIYIVQLRTSKGVKTAKINIQ